MRMRLPSRGPGRRSLAVGTAGAGVLVAAALAVAATGGGGGDGEVTSEDSGAPTVDLERRDLIARETVDGTLGYAGEADVVNRLAGTITWLPAEGDVIDRGRRLFEVDGEPVLLMYGDIPAYRDLVEGVSDGPDVQQLEANLAQLGFDAGGGMTVDDEYTSATAEAVADWQDGLGLEETGEVELGRVAFMAGQRRVTSLSLALGSDAGSVGGGADTGVSAGAGGADTVLARYPAQGVEPKKPSRGKGKDEGKGKGASKDQRPSREVPEPAVQATPEAAATDEDSTGDGASASPSTTVMTTSSERRVVSVALDPSDTELAERGSPARVELPDGKQVKARVASVGTVAESSESADGTESDPTIEVTISLPEGSRVTGLDQAPVTVELTDEIRRDVFAVPVESLLGTAGDDYAIVVRDGGDRRQLTVSPGLYADGYVEVEGDGLREGLAVEVPGE